MKPSVGAVLLVLAALASTSPGEPPAETALEPWLYNPRERTAAAQRWLEEGRAADSLEAADSALRLAPEDPRTHFNSGTLRLLLEAPGAATALEEATRRADGPLLPLAHFNLGNAHLATGRPEAAVEAYEAALRLDPDHEGAKFNLELALRQLDRPPAAPPEPAPAPMSPEGEGAKDLAPGDDEAPSEAKPAPREWEGAREFADQPELTAEQAEAILDAVERLEQRRRKADGDETRRAARGGKDW